MKPTAWGAGLVDLLLPAGCIACRHWIPGGRGAPHLCGRCTSLLRRASWPRCERCHHPRGSGRTETDYCLECQEWAPALGAARYAYVLRPPADDLVHALKYEDWPELAVVMGDDLARLPIPDRSGTGRRTVVVPVPTTASRLRRRGYNQAELLARRVSAVLDLPLCEALLRPTARRSQTALTPAERRENVRGTFGASTPASSRIRGARVLLIDDVLTTGATASEAAATLERHGAETVTLLTYARALAAGPEKSA